MTEKTIPKIPKTLTIFDLDDTIISGDTSALWRDYVIEQGFVANVTEFLQRDAIFNTAYAEGKLNLQECIAFRLEPIMHLPVHEIATLVQNCLKKHALPRINKQAIQTINELRNNNADVLIISASNHFLVKEMATLLGVQHAIGVELAIEDNKFTPKVVGTPSFKKGKVTRLKQWLAQNDPNNSFNNFVFYTDSINDLPLCEFADITRTVNPCAKLKPIAQKNNWDILKWHV